MAGNMCLVDSLHTFSGNATRMQQLQTGYNYFGTITSQLAGVFDLKMGTKPTVAMSNPLVCLILLTQYISTYLVCLLFLVDGDTNVWQRMK